MIEIKNIKKSYGIGENKTQILKRISLSVEESAFTIILGASGSGKSTFLNIISGLERADEGNILYNDIDITKLEDDKLTLFRKQNIGFVIGTLYQYGLLRIMIDIVFKDFEGVPEYKFDIPVMFLSLTCFIIFYEFVTYIYSRKIKNISIKEIMLET